MARARLSRSMVLNRVWVIRYMVPPNSAVITTIDRLNHRVMRACRLGLRFIGFLPQYVTNPANGLNVARFFAPVQLGA